MNTGDDNEDFNHKLREISVYEFRGSERLSFYNSLLNSDLFIISNGNIHLKAINKEVLEFLKFVGAPYNRHHFKVFLQPVIQHLYFLLLSHKGKSDAAHFVSCLKCNFYVQKHPELSPVLESLLRSETCNDVQRLILGGTRIRVKLSRAAYNVLVNWFRECFSSSCEMFHILRIFHENFHLDIFDDKDDEEFAGIEYLVLNGIKLMKEERKKSKIKTATRSSKAPKSEGVTAKTTEITDTSSLSGTSKMSDASKSNRSSPISETSELLISGDDEMSQQMSGLTIDAKTHKSSETSKMLDRNDGETKPGLKSCMFKLRPSAKRHLEKVKETAKKENWSFLQLEKVLLNPPNPNSGDLSEKDDKEANSEDDASMEIDCADKAVNLENQTPIAVESVGMETNSVEDPVSMAVESPGPHIQDTNLVDDQIPAAVESRVSELIEDMFSDVGEQSPSQHSVPISHEGQTPSQHSVPISHEVGQLRSQHSVPVSPEVGQQSVPVSPEDSVYMICSDDSAESKGNEDDDTEVEDTEDTNKDLSHDSETDTSNQQEIQESNSSANSSHPVKVFRFENSYKSNFHSAFPITLSGKDVLCSSDVSSDLKYLACSFESFKIRTWSFTEEFKLERIGKDLVGHKGIVYALSIDSNKKTLISGSHDCTVKIWDIVESTLISEILSHSAPVYAVCVSPNSKYFLSASENKEIALFWYDMTHLVRIYVGHSHAAINCVQFHPNCAYFASASCDGNLFLFKINDLRPVRMLTRHQAKVFTLSFTPCGKQIASADVKGTLIIWDIITQTPIKEIKTGQGIRSISYSRDGSLIAASFYFKSWKVFNVEGDNQEAIIEAKSAGVPKSVHFSNDNKLLIIQYVEVNNSKDTRTKQKPYTTITGKFCK